MGNPAAQRGGDIVEGEASSHTRLGYRVLHTSDWHFGQTLYDRRREDEEFKPFLDWLLGTLTKEKIDLLIVAGDVFDKPTPPPQAQQLYYNFLAQAQQRVKQIVIVAGNHDSPKFLEAPSVLLHAMNVFVVGSANTEEEVFDFGDAIVAAVPFLSERDVRRSETDELLEETTSKIVEGTRAHYAEVIERAEKMRGERDIPIIATGHLFVQGGKTSEGVRELYIGNLGQLRSDIFPDAIDYLALGHLHIPQKLAKDETRRYSGSPLAMSFSEANQQKEMVLISFDGRTPQVGTIRVPKWVDLISLEGDFESLKTQLKSLAKKPRERSILIAINYTGSETIPQLSKELEACVGNDGIEIVLISFQKQREQLLQCDANVETLRSLKPEEMFLRLLDSKESPPELREAIIAAHQEIIHKICNDDESVEK